MKTKFLVFFLLTALILTTLSYCAIPVSAATLTQSQFNSKLAAAKEKYPNGTQKYEWKVNDTVVGWQCHGYARWLSWYVWGVDFANGNGKNWTLYKSTSSSTYIDKLVPGDVVRYRSSTDNKYNHSIFITSISGTTIYFTDCNSDGANTIKWNRSMTKSTLTKYLKISLYGSEAATYGYIAHYTPNTLTTKHTLSIKYNANGGIISSSDYYLKSSLVYTSSSGSVKIQKMVEGKTYSSGLINCSTFGISKTGYTFKGWGTTSTGGTIFDQNASLTAKDVYSKISSGDATITIYAIWEPNKLEIRYNANGGYIPESDSPTYYIDNDQLLRKTATQAYHISNWSYGKTYVGGLVNDTTFGIIKDDYIFKGWSFDKNGGTVYDKNSDRIPEEFYPNLKNSNQVITLYAVWELNVTIGDTDKNGIIDAYDLINLRKMLLGTFSNDSTTISCDLTGDGQIDIRDLVFLKKGLI